MRSRRLRPLALGLAAIALACSPAISPTASSSPRPAVSGPLAAVTPAGSPSGGFDPARVAEILGPTVGEVIVIGNRTIEEGSGFAIAHEGNTTYMITNNHVVASGGRITVLMLDGRHFQATLKGGDPVGDIAVLSIPDGSLPLATFADSSRVRVGQQVVAMGSPLGHQGSVTSGIISAVHRTITAGGGVSGPSETLPDVMQTDAAINPGNSGGPLADAEGHVVGVNTAADRSGTNVGFAIPSLLARRLALDLIAGRKPGHPFLGITLEEEADALAAGDNIPGYGTLVKSVVSGSAADKASLRKGDVIQKVDGVELRNGQTLGGLIQLHEPGDRVTLTVLRDGSTRDLPLVLADRPAGT